MGTETYSMELSELFYNIGGVKLNNPLMGTETSYIHLANSWLIAMWLN